MERVRGWEVGERGVNDLFDGVLFETLTISANVKHVRSKTFPFHTRNRLFWWAEKFRRSAIQHQDNTSLRKQCTLRCISLGGQQERRHEKDLDEKE